MNRTAWLTLIAAAIGGAACDSKKEEASVSSPITKAEAVPIESPRPVAPEAPPPAPVEPPQAFATKQLVAPGVNATVDTVVQHVRDVASATAPELAVRRLSISYVRKDGVLDPTYGKLAVEFTLPDTPDGMVDDPTRPTGAPLPEIKPAEKLRERCPTVTLTKSAWSAYESSCYKTKLLSGPRCSVASIWAMAIAQGAPDNAVAIVDFDVNRGMWSLRINDKVRGVNFNRSYHDDCGAAPGSGSSGSSGSGSGVRVKSNPYAPF